MNFNILDKTKVYCKHCFNENLITELKFDQLLNQYQICSKHKILMGNFRTLRFYENEWKSIRGIAKNAKPQIQGIKHKECENCGFIQDDIIPITNWKCPKCNWIPKNSLMLKDHKNYKYSHVCLNINCKNYNIQIINNILPQNWTCECGFRTNYFKCKKCNSNLISPLQICKNCGYDIHSDIYFCEKCKGKITNPFSRCNNCDYKKIQIIICPKCGNNFDLQKRCKCGFSILEKHRSNLAKQNLINMNFSLFKEENNLLYIYSSIENKYIPWNDFKNKFKTQNIDFQLPEGFKLYPTFRSQDSKNWIGAKSAFEQSLVDENIGWFVYIKFDENNKPLVVGKSGSLLVNLSGSDISFSMNEKDGPARKYLQEEGITWNKTQIAICKCNTEQDALNKEKIILNKLNLFSS